MHGFFVEIKFSIIKQRNNPYHEIFGKEAIMVCIIFRVVHFLYLYELIEF